MHAHQDHKGRPRLLIVGGNGFVGAACHEALRGSMDVSLTTRSGTADTVPLDLRQPEVFDYGRIQPGDTVLFAAAISSPDICGREPELARQVNVTGPAAFLREALRRGARAIFLSSDTVVGAHDQPAAETVTPVPHGHYARLKHELEEILLPTGATKVLRLSLVISLQDKFTAYLRQCVRTGREPDLLHPIYRNAIHLTDVIRLVEQLTLQWDAHPARLIHAAGPRCLSRIGLAEQFFASAGYDGGYTVTRPPADFYAQRPERIALRSLHLASILGHEPIAISTGYAGELAREKSNQSCQNAH